LRRGIVSGCRRLRRELEIGCHAGQIGRIADLRALQPRAGQRRDRDRRLLKAFVAAAGRDDDILKTRVRLRLRDGL
jgi:hypothetical protein